MGKLDGLWERMEQHFALMLIIGGFIIGMTFWSIDFAFLACESGNPVYLPLGLLGGEVSYWDWWNISWAIMFFIGIPLIAFGCYYLGKYRS